MTGYRERPTTEAALDALNVRLPPPSEAKPTFASVVQTGSLVFVSGRVPVGPDGRIIAGRVGATIETEEAHAAARVAAIRAVSELKHHLGDLDRVARIVRVFGMVNSTPDFTDHAKVIDGASEFLIQLFGDRGRHARCVAGMYSLLGGAVLELEIIVEVSDPVPDTIKADA